MLGDPTAKQEGRMTLNPAVHIDPIGTIILPLLGMLFGVGFFGWARPVPVDWRNLKNPKRDMMLIAAAGPIMNLICTLVILVGLKILVTTMGPPSRGAVGYFLTTKFIQSSAIISVFLAVFNMLPLFPLDGYSVVYGLLPWRQAQEFAKLRPYGMAILMGIIFIPNLLRIPNPVFFVIREVAYGLFNVVATLVGLR
jgi:Zn-dependent protease